MGAWCLGEGFPLSLSSSIFVTYVLSSSSFGLARAATCLFSFRSVSPRFSACCGVRHYVRPHVCCPVGCLLLNVCSYRWSSFLRCFPRLCWSTSVRVRTCLSCRAVCLVQSISRLRSVLHCVGFVSLRVGESPRIRVFWLLMVVQLVSTVPC